MSYATQLVKIINKTNIIVVFITLHLIKSNYAITNAYTIYSAKNAYTILISTCVTFCLLHVNLVISFSLL